VAFAVPHDTVLISDGGLATELEARGHDLSDDLWSARLLVDAPGEITAVHAAFFRAGAVFATTASYQASFDGFAARGIGRDAAHGCCGAASSWPKLRATRSAGNGGWPHP
jgi:homocysteine S-methyltransferase